MLVVYFSKINEVIYWHVDQDIFMSDYVQVLEFCVHETGSM